jgi:predicted molibdopterin-dependent oxidoreductase YjgC
MLMPEIVVDGNAVTVADGVTIAAALMAGGTRSWRTTRITGRPRGLFCGMGVCFDCLVTVNGEPNVRACITVVEPGDVIDAQQGTGRDGGAS